MTIYYVAMAAAVLALLFALFSAISIAKKPVGGERMREISTYIHDGAMAFIKREYMIISIFMVLLFALIWIFINVYTAICFLCGAACSMLAGFVGMKVATFANVRCANAAQNSITSALKVAFSGGSVMGMSVVGLGLLGLSVCWVIFEGSTDPVGIITGFSLGASFIALFSRVGGGIYTKAADVGADLVGKVEAGIPEDDPRNPAVIADNVGDNVGDVCGMGADLFESYVGSIISCIALAVLNFGASAKGYIFFTFAIVAMGIVASIIGSLMVGVLGTKSPQAALNGGNYISMGLFVIGSLVASRLILASFQAAFVVIIGLAAGALIGKLTELYTSGDYRTVKEIANKSETGAATNVISGISAGMKSTCLLIVVIVAAILCAVWISPDMGIALVAVGMLSTTGMTVAVDAYGPIADNAGGIAEMCHLPEEVRERTDKLDSVGNTTAAIGKGFAIGSAALTALALFSSYAKAVGINHQNFMINILEPKTVVGLLIGGMLPFLFSSLAINAVSKAAGAMIEEVRRQFKTTKGIMEGKAKPDYIKCVDISTKAALSSMIVPALIAVVVPVAVGLWSATALGGLLAGALITGVMLAIFMANSGGAWDNAKKYIEEGHHGGKGSDAHKAAVIGDTVGDPFKDTSGPSLNILIKLMSIVSLVFAVLFTRL